MDAVWAHPNVMHVQRRGRDVNIWAADPPGGKCQGSPPYSMQVEKLPAQRCQGGDTACTVAVASTCSAGAPVHPTSLTGLKGGEGNSAVHVALP